MQQAAAHRATRVVRRIASEVVMRWIACAVRRRGDLALEHGDELLLVDDPTLTGGELPQLGPQPASDVVGQGALRRSLASATASGDSPGA